MFNKLDKVRLREDTEFSKGDESITLLGSDGWPSKMTMVCISDEENGYVNIAGPGVKARLLAEKLRFETPEDLD
jgi:hypothetical protein